LQSYGAFNTGSFPTEVLGADFDGDGKADIALTNQIGKSLSLYHNVTGTFPTPTISSFSPGAGLAGSTLTINGTNFDPVPANNSVSIGTNGTQAYVQAASTTSLTVLVPPFAVGTNPISVTINCIKATSAASFTVSTFSCSSPRTFGMLDNSFNSSITAGELVAIQLQSSGKSIVATSHTNPISIGTTSYTGLLRFNTDGTLDASFTNQNFDPAAQQLAIQKDDKIIVVNNYLGNSTFIARLNADGTTDNSFTGPSYPNGAYQDQIGPILLQSDGRILYSIYDGTNGQYYLYRLNADGSSDNSFNAPLGLYPTVMKQQADGKIVIGGSNPVQRLDTSGNPDPSFNIGSVANTNVRDMDIQADGKIILVGNISSIQGVPCNNVVRLNTDGSIDFNFLVNTGNGIDVSYGIPTSVKVLSNASILLGGGFTNFNSVTKNQLTLVKPDGNLDCTFDTGQGTVGGNTIDIAGLAIQPDGKILIAGSFTSYDGISIQVLARVNYCVPPGAPNVVGANTCGAGKLTLTASGGSNGNYIWYDQTQAVIAGQTNSTYTTPNLTSTANYSVAIVNGLCTSPTTPVAATINLIPNTPATTGASACGAGSLTLTAVGATNGNYIWYDQSQAVITGQTNSTYTTPNLTSTTNYSAAITNGTCTSTTTPVTATINALPNPPTASGASSCGPGSVTLTASGATNGNYIWYDPNQAVITSQTNSVYTTPSLTSTINYSVAITNGTCTSPTTPVTATINTLPNAPTVTGASVCRSAAATLNASGGLPGQYIWYTAATGGTPVPGQNSSSYTTPSLATTTTFFVSIYNGTCESTRAPVTAIVQACLPTISTQTLNAAIGGNVSLNLVPLIMTVNSALDINSITVTIQPSSGAKAIITNGVLAIDYTGISFSGTDNLTISACDVNGDCTSQQFDIIVNGDIVVYNALSPNGANPIFFIEYIDLLPETKNNTVTIFDRWENQVWKGTNYNNVTVVFKGVGDFGNDLPTGTYFYRIDFASDRKSKTGFIALRR
jgi:uncharacterized delta-60 repeat protein